MPRLWDVPELFRLILSELDDEHLFQASLACRSFWEAVMPIVWGTIAERHGIAKRHDSADDGPRHPLMFFRGTVEGFAHGWWPKKQERRTRAAPASPAKGLEEQHLAAAPFGARYRYCLF